jgi:DNA-directed RNA polymerase specialized sigma24 family protein
VTVTVRALRRLILTPRMKISKSPGRPKRIDSYMMSPSHSITRCIDMLKRGDRAAAEALWDSYIHRIVALARARLGGMPRRAADEEDVALSAFDSFYRRAERGQFARLADRDDLWQILVLITERKAIDLMRHEGRQSRGEGRVVAFSDVEGQASGDIVDPGPTPEFAAQVVDEFRELLERLGDDSLRSVALAKMEGYTNKQIADRLGCIEQTVERKLRSIRKIWSTELTT